MYTHVYNTFMQCIPTHQHIVCCVELLCAIVDGCFTSLRSMKRTHKYDCAEPWKAKTKLPEATKVLPYRKRALTKKTYKFSPLSMRLKKCFRITACHC